jgi:hypothetical protein
MASATRIDPFEAIAALNAARDNVTMRFDGDLSRLPHGILDLDTPAED